NEQYAMPPMPGGAPDGILKGLYRFRATANPKAPLRAQLFGSGAILTEVIKAQEVLESKYNVGADVWSVTSYSELYSDGHACERGGWPRRGAGDEGARRESGEGESGRVMTDFTLPELGESIASGDVLRVLGKPGDTLEKDQPVVELETDKATIEVPSSVAGRVT